MKKHFLHILLAITAFALLLRAVVCFQLADSPEVKKPNSQTDMATYLKLAQDVRNGNFPEFYDYQPFYYTAVLPLLTTQSNSRIPLLVFQTIIGAATVYLTGLVAAMIFGRRFAWLAALLLALSRFHVFYTPFALYEVLQSFWTILLFFLTLKAYKHNTWIYWLLATVTLSVAILTRGNALLFLPILLAAAFYRNKKHLLRTTAIAAALCAIAWLPQLPFAIKNYNYTGRWTGPSTAAPKVLALGNTPEAPAAGLAYPLTYSKWVQQSDENTKSMMTNIFQWFLSEPLAFCELKFRTLLAFWDSEEIPNNVNIDVHGKPFSFILRSALMVNFGLISMLAIAGIILLSRRRAGRCRLLIAFTLMFCFATIAFYMLARFRVAILPLLCILAAGAVNDIAVIRKLPLTLDKRKKATILACFAVAFSAYVAFLALPLYKLVYEADVHALLQPDGIAVVFPYDVALIHDHGPLPMGDGPRGTVTMDGATMQKTFVIPQELRQELEYKPFTVRLMIVPPIAPAATMTLDHVRVTHGNITKPPTEFATRYAFSRFVETQFDELHIQPDGTVQVAFHFLPSHVPRAHVVVDYSRDYGRTKVIQQGEATTIDAEPYAELEFNLRSSRETTPDQTAECQTKNDDAVAALVP